MEKSKATILYTTPSTLITLIYKGGLSNAQLSLRHIMYAGESFPLEQLKKLKEILPDVNITNLYGPTETNVITYFPIKELNSHEHSIPLGKAIDNTEIIVVSEKNPRVCNVNEVGELWCRGDTVTLGYLGLSEKTRECLANSPFHKYPTKFWRTGDYGYYDEKGLLHYKGRKDNLIKVRGYRIEIGEIESILSKYKGLQEFAVVSLPDKKYGSKLYCFFSCLENHSIEPHELKDFLLKYLPDYMIPFQFFRVESLPKTSSEKIDRILLSETVIQSM